MIKLKKKLRRAAAAVLSAAVFLSGCSADVVKSRKTEETAASDAERVESGLEKRLPVTETEKTDTQAQMLAAADLCAAHYLKAQKTSPELPGQEAVIRQIDRDAMEEALIAAGYCVMNSDAVYPEYAENPDTIYGFWEKAAKEQTAEAKVWSIAADGALTCRVFRFEDGTGSCLHAAGEWNEKGKLRLSYLEKKEILYWELTESGFLYQDAYLNRHYNTAVFLRLKPAEHILYELTEKYILPVGYHNVNLFLLDWDTEDYGHVCFNDLFSGLYRIKYGTYAYAQDYPSADTPFYHSVIPADLFESVVFEHFDIPLDEFRKRALYDPENDAYPWQDIDGNNVLYYPELIPEVTKVTDNADGTVTLTVNVICPEKHTDCLFVHEVTLQTEPDGAFRYLSNRITARSENELPSPQARIEVQRFDTSVYVR